RALARRTCRAASPIDVSDRVPAHAAGVVPAVADAQSGWPDHPAPSRHRRRLYRSHRTRRLARRRAPAQARRAARSEGVAALLFRRRTDRPSQEGVAERPHVRGLLEVTGAVTALERLVEEYRVAEGFEARRHLACMAGMHAVVAA